MELHAQVYHILFLTKIWITIGFGINKTSDTKSSFKAEKLIYFSFPSVLKHKI